MSFANLRDCNFQPFKHATTQFGIVVKYSETNKLETFCQFLLQLIDIKRGVTLFSNIKNEIELFPFSKITIIVFGRKTYDEYFPLIQVCSTPLVEKKK